MPRQASQLVGSGFNLQAEADAAGGIAGIRRAESHIRRQRFVWREVFAVPENGLFELEAALLIVGDDDGHIPIQQALGAGGRARAKPIASDLEKRHWLFVVRNVGAELQGADRKSTRLNSSHLGISY